MQARRPGGRGAEKLVNDKTSVQAGRKTCSQPRSCRGTWCFENGDQAPWVLGRPSGKRRAKQFPPRRFQDAPTLNCGRPHAAARSPGQKEPPRTAQPRAHGRGAAAGAGGSARTAAETRRCAGATLEKGSARTDVNAGGGGTAGTAGTRASRSERARVPTKRGRHTTHTAGPRPGATGASGVRSPGLRAPRGLRLAQRAGPAARPRTPQSAARTPRSSSSGSETQRRKRPGALARPAAPGMQARAHLRAPAHLAPAVWPARPRAHSPGLPSSGETCSYLPWCSKGMLF